MIKNEDEDQMLVTLLFLLNFLFILLKEHSFRLLWGTTTPNLHVFWTTQIFNLRAIYLGTVFLIVIMWFLLGIIHVMMTILLYFLIFFHLWWLIEVHLRIYLQIKHSSITLIANSISHKIFIKFQTFQFFIHISVPLVNLSTYPSIFI